MKLVLNLHPQIVEEAQRLTRRRCLQGLAETLSELAFDIAQCETRPGSWEAEKVRDWIDSHYLPLEALQDLQEGEPHPERRA